MRKEAPAVYLVEHKPTGRVYVGSTSNLSKRWSRHRKDLAAGTGLPGTTSTEGW